MKASMAWQDFRHSNLVSTSTPQVRDGDGEDSDGAEEDGFVGANSNGPQEVIMEIMDKYVLAGEALAEKENDVRQLRKEVDAAKAVNSDLQTRVSHLTTANEKLADDEGRWYSLARELENQMDVIKKGETYSLFQDKVDEAEARLEVAADTSHTCRKRLFEVYGEVNADFKVNDNDGGDGDVDEHRRHTMVVEELRHLKSVAKENQDALAVSQDAYSSAELAKKEQAQEAELRRRLEAQVSQLQEEAVAQDEAAQSGQNALREAFAKQSQEVRQALEALSTAQTTARAAEDARQIAIVAASTAEAKVAGMLEDLKLAHEETQKVEGHLAEVRAALGTAQEETRHKDEARDFAESRMQDLSGRVIELERDLTDSSQKIAELTHVAQVSQEEVVDVTTKSAELQALAVVQERRCTESSERISELLDTVQALRSQLDERDEVLNRAQSEKEEALLNASVVAERAEGLRQELERISLDASTAEREHAAHAERMREEMGNITADAAGAEQHALRVQELHHELESTRRKAAAAAEENATRTNTLCQELEAANATVTSAAEKNEVLRQELVRANATAASAEQERAAHVERLRQDLDNANKDLVASQNSEIASREELERATFALADAEDEMAKIKQARSAAEAEAEMAESIRGEAETQMEDLRRQLALKDMPSGTADMRVAQGGSTLIATGYDAEAAAQVLQEARDDVLETKARLMSANQACEELRHHAAKLADEVHGLEAELFEARASSIQLDKNSQEQREALQNSDMRANQLEQTLAALQADLYEKTAALKHAEEESRTTAPSGSAGNCIGPALSVNGNAYGDVLIGSPAPENSANPSDDVKEEGTASPNGLVPACRSAEAEELQAHAEAMELELRYTLESFEGQLSAMAREKVAIQKQVKELSGQCTTLRKQVSHYKKVARESEAQVEQMLELQQQLCDAERSAEKIHSDNNNLCSANRDLKAELEILQADRANENHERMWRQSQDEVMELRTRIVQAEEDFAAKSQELAAKSREEASARELATALEQYKQEAEAELLSLQEVSRSTAEQLSSAVSSASELQCAIAKVSELENIVGDLKSEKLRLEEITAALTGQLDQARSKLEELQESIRSVEEEKMKMSLIVQEAEEGRATLVMEMRRIAVFVGCACIDAEDAKTFCPIILDAITLMKDKFVAAEEVLGATAQALLPTMVVGEVEVDSASRWIIDGVKSLQRRLQVAELELSQRAGIHGGDGLDGHAKLVEALSAALDCDKDKITHKVHELKRLAHDLSEPRDKHFNQIPQLKYDPISTNVMSTSRSRTTSQDTPGDDRPAVSEQAAVIQVTTDSSVYELTDTRGKETKELRGEEVRQQEGSEGFSCFIERTNGSGAKHPCVHDRRRSSHRKSSSLQLGASSTHGWLLDLEKEGHEVRANGADKPCDCTGTNVAVVTSGGPVASESTEVLAKIQAMLGCTMQEVIATLSELQAASQREKLTNQILGDVKETFLNDMDILASAIGHEAVCKVSPLLAQASELWSLETCLLSNREGREILHKATGILANVASESTAANVEMAKVALRQSQEEVATLNETLRKERLMMMAFRRWGHFYLALSNEALRKRTKERNQARSQTDDPENESLSIIQGPHIERGRSRRSSSAGRRSCGRGRLQLSSSEVQIMVEQEAKSVARELAAEPSMSLIALADARKEMDEIAMKAQATLGVLYTQSPLTHDANVATDDIIPLGIVEKVPDGKVIEDIQEVVPSPVRSISLVNDVSHSELDVTLAAEAESVSATGKAILAPPMVPPMPVDQQRADSGDVFDRTKLPKDGADSRSGAEEDITPLPTQLSTSPPSAPPKTGLSNKSHGAKASDETGTGHGSGGGIPLTVNAPPSRTTGPLVEDGISKKDRAEFLRRQREERKANRKRGMQASASRAKPVEPSGNVGIRNRRTSAPATMPSTADVLPGFVASHNPATSPSKAQTPSESDAAQTSTIAVGDDVAADRSQVRPLSTPSTADSQITAEQQRGGVGLGLSAQTDSSPAGAVVAPPTSAVRAPPPRMFNPTAVPPPIAPPSVAPSSHAQQSRHPSMAFNVNETVERALTEARRDAGVAQRKAAFWRCRFRDLAVWATSFVLLAYASDHGFDDC